MAGWSQQLGWGLSSPITITLVLCFIIRLQRPVYGIIDDSTQARILEFQKESKKYGIDTSGLLYPPHFEAVHWIQDFRRTGLPMYKTSPRLDKDAELHNVSSFCDRDNDSRLYCGMHVKNETTTRKNVLIVPVGDYWNAAKWLDRPDDASFDIIALYHGENKSFSCSLCSLYLSMKGPKWRLYYQFVNSPHWEAVANKYEYIMLPDDDLGMDTCTINAVFTVMKSHDLVLGQPSVCEGQGSATWRPELHQRLQYELRYTTFVEVMAPTFRMDFFDKVARHAFSEHWTYVGWGLDSLWPAFLGYPKNRIGIVDVVCVSHVPTPGGLGSTAKPESVYRKGLSPFSPDQELDIVFRAYRYSKKVAEHYGETFVGIRIVGGVVNKFVACAMNRAIGARWTGLEIALSEQNALSVYIHPVQNVKVAHSRHWILIISICAVLSLFLHRNRKRRRMRYTIISKV